MAIGPNNIKPTFDPAAFSRIEGMKPGGAGGVSRPTVPGSAKDGAAPSGVDFKKALEDAVAGRQPQGVGKTGQPEATSKVGGATASTSATATSLKFSNHAVDRMRSRGINFGAEEMARIENGVARAAAKGSKDALVLSGENALIVSVKNNTIVTVMDKAGMKDNVFTNIDSTVVV